MDPVDRRHIAVCSSTIFAHCMMLSSSAALAAAMLSAATLSHRVDAIVAPQNSIDATARPTVQPPTITDAGLMFGPSADTCSRIKNRTDCGYMGIDTTECEERGCCYEKQSGSPSCYFAGEGTEITTVHMIFSNHLDIGYTSLAP